MPLDVPAHLNIAEEFVTRLARAHPDRPAILGDSFSYSYRDVENAVNRAGNALRALGCRPGDRVLIILPDSIEFVAAFFGAAKLGAIAVPVNSTARTLDYEYYASDCGAGIAIVHASALAEFSPVARRRKFAACVIAGEPTEDLTSLAAEVSRWNDWIAAASPELAPHSTAANDSAFFLYTSGSGGIPKAAVHRHQDMFVTSRSFAWGVLGLRPEDKTFSVSKLFFAYGLGNGMYFPFSAGASTVLMGERPRPERVAELVARHRPTVFFCVPTFYGALLREAERGLALDFSSVRLAVSAGEALPPEIFERFRERFGIEILDGIGSTEMLHMFLSCRPGAARAGTCGVEVPNYETKIVDEKEEPVRDGEIGNLWVKGGSAFAAYWNKAELTARTRRGEWVVTGDKFFRDADGYYHYCGRGDDMMKVAGMWVSPGEVENALLGHVAVAEAAVVGQADAVGLVRPMAYIVLQEGVKEEPMLGQEIREWLRSRLAAHKCPQEIRFVSELPKTATGKIQRFRLRGSSTP